VFNYHLEEIILILELYLFIINYLHFLALYKSYHFQSIHKQALKYFNLKVNY